MHIETQVWARDCDVAEFILSKAEGLLAMTANRSGKDSSEVIEKLRIN